MSRARSTSLNNKPSVSKALISELRDVISPKTPPKDQNEGKRPRARSSSPSAPLIQKAPANLLVAAQKGNWEYILNALNEGSVLIHTKIPSPNKKKHPKPLIKTSVAPVTPELLNQCDKQGKTLLHYAAAFGSSSLVDALIQNGADVTISDSTEKTPLYLASLSSTEKKEKLDVLLPQALTKRKMTNLSYNGDYTAHWNVIWNTLHQTLCEDNSIVPIAIKKTIIIPNIEHLITLTRTLDTPPWDKILSNINIIPESICTANKKQSLRKSVFAEKRYYLEQRNETPLTTETIGNKKFSPTDILMQNTIFENQEHKNAFQEVFTIAETKGDSFCKLVVATMAIRCLKGTKIFIADGEDIGSLYHENHKGVYDPSNKTDYLILSGFSAAKPDISIEVLGINFFHESIHAILQEAEPKHAHKMKPFPCRKHEAKEMKIEKNAYKKAIDSTISLLHKAKDEPLSGNLPLSGDEEFIVSTLTKIFVANIENYNTSTERHQEYIALTSQVHFMCTRLTYDGFIPQSNCYTEYAQPLIAFMQETLPPVIKNYLEFNRPVVEKLNGIEEVLTHMSPPPIPPRRSTYSPPVYSSPAADYRQIVGELSQRFTKRSDDSHLTV